MLTIGVTAQERALNRLERSLWIAGVAYWCACAVAAYCLNFDHLALLASAKNFINGRGWMIGNGQLRDLSNGFYVPLTFWPPGYSVFLVPLLKADVAPKWAVIFLDCVGFGLIYGSLFLILRSLRSFFSRSQTLLYAALASFVAPPFFQDYCNFGTNIIALGFVLLGIWLLLAAAMRPSSGPWAFASGLAFGTATGFRFAYGAASVCPIALLAVLAIRKRAELGRLIVPYVSGLASILVCLAYWALVYAKGPLAPVGNPEHWLHLFRLYKMNLFPLWSVFNDRLYPLFDLHGWGDSPTLVTPPVSMRIVAIAATLVICTAAVRDVFSIAKLDAEEYFPIRFFYALAIVVFAGVIAEPLAMSMLHPQIERSFVADWTYIQEPRYFNYCYPIILLFVVHFLFSPRNNGFDNFLKSSLAAFIVISFCLRPLAAPRPFMVSEAAKIRLFDMPHDFVSRFRWIAGRRNYVDDAVDLGLSDAIDQMPANFVYVEFGGDSIEFYERNLEVNLAGTISACYSGTGNMSTSRPIHILAGLQPGARPEVAQSFSKFCATQSATPVGGANQLSLHQCDFSPSTTFQ